MYGLLSIIVFAAIFGVAARHEEMPNPGLWAGASALLSVATMATMGLFFVVPAQVALFVGMWVYNARHQKRRGAKWASQAAQRRREEDDRKRWAEEQIARERAEREQQ